MFFYFGPFAAYWAISNFERFVIRRLLHWALYCIGRFVFGSFVIGHFVFGRFYPLPEDTNYSIGGMVIYTQDTNNSIGGMLINTKDTN